jgi:predicted ATPase
MAATPGLVGRDAELGRLAGLLDDLRAGRGAAVLVEGEPGIGKSALLRTGLAAA